MFSSIPFYPSQFTLVGDGEPDLGVVSEFIEKNLTNEKVVGFLNKVRAKLFNEDTVKQYLDTEDGKKISTKLFDSRVNDAVQNHDKKFKTEKLPILIDEERTKIMTELKVKETPEAKELREQSDRIKKLEYENKRSKLLSQALEVINEAKLPFAKIAEKFLTDDIESTIKNIQDLKVIWDAELTAKATELAAGNNGRQVDTRTQDKPSPLEVRLEVARKANNLLEVLKIKNEIAAEKAKQK
jgi:hypothetical protein